MKNRKLIAAGLVVGVIAILVVCCLPSPDHLQVIGELSQNDLAAIKKAIHREIWRGTLPDYSWNSLKNLPRQVILNQKQHVLLIDLQANGLIQAIVSRPNPWRLKTSVDELMILQKDKEGWKAARGIRKELVMPKNTFHNQPTPLNLQED